MAGKIAAADKQTAGKEGQRPALAQERPFDLTPLRAQIDRELAGCGLGPPLPFALRGRASSRRRKRTLSGSGPAPDDAF